MSATETSWSILDMKKGQYEGKGLYYDVQVPQSGQWKGWAFVKGGLPKAELDALDWTKRKTIATQRPGHYLEFNKSMTPAQVAGLLEVCSKYGEYEGRIAAKGATPVPAARRGTTSRAKKPADDMPTKVDSCYDISVIDARHAYKDGRLIFTVQHVKEGRWNGWSFMQVTDDENKVPRHPKDRIAVGAQAPGETFKYYRDALDGETRKSLFALLDTLAANTNPTKASVGERGATFVERNPENKAPDGRSPKNPRRKAEPSVRDRVRALHGLDA